MQRLKDRVAVVTGAGSGLGKAIALGYAKEGAKVIIADICEESGLQVEALIKEEGHEALFIKTDVTKASSVNSMAKKAIEAYKKIDLLCNNTGACIEAKHKIRIVELTDNEWDYTLDLGLKSIHNCCRAIIPHIINAGGGTIVNISSIAGSVPTFSAAFAATKAGVVAITKSIAIQYADDNIRCNCICPGAFETPGGLAAGKKGLYSDVDTRRVRLIQRFGRPEDIANAAIFLSCDESSYITATSLAVDGGMLSLVTNIPPRQLTKKK